MRLCSLALGACLALLGAALPGAARATLLISIDKSAQRMSVVVDGRQVYSWPVSTGRAGYSTPAGSFKPFRMEADHYSKEWDDAPMPHSIFFTRVGHAIHGSYDVRRLGSPASHGCVRLAPGNAARLFALVRQEGLEQTRIVLGGEERMRRQPLRETVAADRPRRRAPPLISDEYGIDPSEPDDFDRSSGVSTGFPTQPMRWR